MVVPPTALNAIRQELRARRLAFASGNPARPLVQSTAFEGLIASAKCVGSYVPMTGEPDPMPLLGDLSVTALPRVEAEKGRMTFRTWRGTDPLIKATWGGTEPQSDAPMCTPDLILVPLLGFDLDFNRLGQGGGYYDRYLAAHPSACRIGLAWECQRLDRIDARNWDVPVDGILTETTFYIKDLTRCHHL